MNTIFALFALLGCVSFVAAVPLCRSNEGAQGLFPLWPATYDMRDSTVIQPCNKTGYLDPSFAEYGLVSIDWSNAKQIWVAPPMSCEEQLVEQAARLKAVRPGVRVMGCVVLYLP
jgi:hypothetical protein